MRSLRSSSTQIEEENVAVATHRAGVSATILVRVLLAMIGTTLAASAGLSTLLLVGAALVSP